MSSTATHGGTKARASRPVITPEETDLHDYRSLLRESLPLSIVMLIVGLCLGFLLSTVQSPSFVASSRLLVTVGSASNLDELETSTTFSQERLQTYAELAKTPTVVSAVIADLDLDATVAEVSGQVSAAASSDTTIVTITTAGSDAATTAAMATSFAKNLTATVGAIEKSDNAELGSVILLTIQTGESTITQTGPDVAADIALGGLTGLALAALIVVTRLTLDTRIRDRRELSRLSEVPVLATFAWDRQSAINPVVTEAGPRSEEFKTLRTNLLFVHAGMEHRSYLFTSSVAGEGKSSTAVNLAIALAESGVRVLLVDTDLRRPTLARYLDLEGAVGLTDVLAGIVSIEDALQSWGRHSLSVLPAGHIPPNPSELLGSPVMARFMRSVAKQFDVVIYDTPPLLAVTDAAVLAEHVDDVFLVVSVGSTRRQDFLRSLQAIRAVNTQVGGLVVTLFGAGGSAKRRARQASYVAHTSMNG